MAGRILYTVSGSNGDEAEAYGFSAAQTAARTLVEDDGNRLAVIFHGDRWIAEYHLDGDGRGVLLTTQGRREEARS